MKTISEILDQLTHADAYQFACITRDLVEQQGVTEGLVDRAYRRLHELKRNEREWTESRKGK